MLSEELVDIATRHQVYLERFKAGEVKRTDALYQRLNKELAAILEKVDELDLSLLTFAQQSALYAAVRSSTQDAYMAHLSTVVTALQDLAVQEQEFELESIDEVTEDDVQPGSDEEADALWAAVLAAPVGATGMLLAKWFGKWASNEVERSEAMVRRAVAEGWTKSQLVAAFRGTKASGYTDGLYGSSKRNTATTINTAVQHTSIIVRASTMKNTTLYPRVPKGDRPKVDEEGNVTSIPKKSRRAAERAGIKVGTNVRLMGYRWVSILDSKTSQTCRSLDGQVFKFGHGPLPPAHPNCRSSIIAEIPGRWLKRGPTGRFVKRDERSAQGPDGKQGVDGGTTYYEWLKQQPEAFQIDAIGVTRAALLRKGGMSAATFAKLNLGRNFQPLTLEEMRRLKPNAFKRAGV